MSCKKRKINSELHEEGLLLLLLLIIKFRFQSILKEIFSKHYFLRGCQINVCQLK